MIKGSIQMKNDRYYACINLKDQNGKRKVKWVNLGLDVGATEEEINLAYYSVLLDYTKGEAEKEKEPFIQRKSGANHKKEKSTSIEAESNPCNDVACMFYPDYIDWFLQQTDGRLQRGTKSHYQQMNNYRIRKAFSSVRLCDLTPQMITDFYKDMISEGLSPNTALRYNALISSSCKYAFKHDIIEKNIMEKVEKPSHERYTGAQYYTPEELAALLKVFENDPMYLLVYMTVCYGLRRSEVLGLKWDAIDFERNRIYIRHKVVTIKENGQCKTVGTDKMKTEKSRREFPLIPAIADALVKEMQRQKVNKITYGEEYSTDYSEYIFVNEKGVLFRPDYVSRHFEIVLKNNNLKRIRFHDLRHSCASMLILQNKSLKDVQEWMGHSNISTTADIYSHISFEQKLECGNSIQQALGV